MYTDSPLQVCVFVCVIRERVFLIPASSVQHLLLFALLGLCAMSEELPRIWKRTKRWGIRKVKDLHGIPGWWARHNLFYLILSKIKDPIEREHFFESSQRECPPTFYSTGNEPACTHGESLNCRINAARKKKKANQNHRVVPQSETGTLRLLMQFD